MTYENQEAASDRGHFYRHNLRDVNRFISYEPALSPVHWGPILERGLIKWLICGAETGPKARPMDLDWARAARDACRRYGVAFFMKSAGPGIATPKDLRIREFPEGMTP